MLYAVFALTILLTRLGLLIWPISSPQIGSFRVHHWMYGLVLVSFAFIFKSKSILAIGLALFVDELSFVLLGGKTHEDNYSLPSLTGTLIFMILVFVFRMQLFA